MRLAEPQRETASTHPAPWRARFSTSRDGLRLFLREYGSERDPGLPIVCLAGLSRNSADFDPLAQALAGGLAGGRRRRVLALDYRGRGRSDRDSDWRRYSMQVEQEDILTALKEAGVERAVIVGTSRGGMHAMLFASTAPNLLAGVVLNDIGPVLETQGLTRISGYVGKFTPPRSLAESVALLKRVMKDQFVLPEADWETYARLTFCDETGAFGSRYDPALREAVRCLIAEPPPLWDQFDRLSAVPLLTIRGANSDLLSAETLAEMERRHPHTQTYVVENQGHPVLLIDAASIGRVAAFIAEVEARG